MREYGSARHVAIVANRLGRDHNSAGVVCAVSDEICHYHAVAYHGFVCRTSEILRLSNLYDAMGDICVLSACALDVAPRGNLRTDARA